MRRRSLVLLPAAALLPATGCLAAPGAPGAPASGAAADPWALLGQGGRVVLMRHAATDPGVGDPPGFRLAECSTQRNLSDAGRRDAARIGAAFRRHGVPVAAVLSSRWCRCLDTARIAFGRVAPAPMLDSMFRDGGDERERKLAALRAYLAKEVGRKRGKELGNIVLVTHDVNIRALGGGYVEQGDLVVAVPGADGGLAIEATLPHAAI